MMSKTWAPALAIVVSLFFAGSAVAQDEEQSDVTTPDPMLVVTESEDDPGLVGEGDEIVEGYYESSYLLDEVKGDSESDLIGSWWDREAATPTMETLETGIVHDSEIHIDGCATSDGDFGGIMFRDDWVAPDGVPNW